MMEADIIDSDDLRKMRLIFDLDTKQFRPEHFHLTLFRTKSLDVTALFEAYQGYEFGEV